MNTIIKPKNWRFLHKIYKTDTCWIWMGGQGGGYGKFRMDGKPILAHRYSYLIHKGQIKPAMVIHHICHNHLCVNPDHLEQITKAENCKAGGRIKNTHRGGQG